MVWDYHVILVLEPRSLESLGAAALAAADSEDSAGGPGDDANDQGDARSWVYDFDSHLPTPCPWEGEVFLARFTGSFRRC